jgi:hypothetical protein
MISKKRQKIINLPGSNLLKENEVIFNIENLGRNTEILNRMNENNNFEQEIIKIKKKHSTSSNSNPQIESEALIQLKEMAHLLYPFRPQNNDDFDDDDDDDDDDQRLSFTIICN